MSAKYKKVLIIILCVFMLSACGKAEESVEGKLIKVGFSQLGYESDWRAANTLSMTEALSEEHGYELLYENAKQRQDNQLLAIRNFVLQNVDIIILAPVSETGWDNALAEARNAGIPVIIVDREVDVENENLYLCAIGSDFFSEGITAVNWLEEELVKTGRDKEEIRIFNLKGTKGATAEIGRTKAIEKAAAEHNNWNINAEYFGEFTEAKAYEIVRDFLNSGGEMDVLYSQNDNMTFGAMKAFDEAGISYGEGGDVIIISFDAVQRALSMCMEGKINLCVECSPLHGPRVEELIRAYLDGEEIDKKIYVEESFFTPENLSEEIISERQY
ncbi:MAG: ABC transporter substrate-binding protein [Clostridia bacterium]|nr:ABC transporter substrate-binding protein [Clostridia bacterium]